MSWLNYWLNVSGHTGVENKHFFSVHLFPISQLLLLSFVSIPYFCHQFSTNYLMLHSLQSSFLDTQRHFTSLYTVSFIYSHVVLRADTSSHHCANMPFAAASHQKLSTFKTRNWKIFSEAAASENVYHSDRCFSALYRRGIQQFASFIYLFK